METLATLYLFLMATTFVIASIQNWLDGERDGGLALFISILMVLALMQLRFG